MVRKSKAADAEYMRGYRAQKKEAAKQKDMAFVHLKLRESVVQRNIQKKVVEVKEFLKEKERLSELK